MSPATSVKGPLPCPPPIGPIPREDCAEVAEEFSPLAGMGAVHVSGTGRADELRAQAVRAAQTLADAIKAKRVGLCKSYGECKVTAADHDTQDRALSDAMHALVNAWTGRHLSQMEEIAAFREKVRAIERLVNGRSAEPPKAAEPKVLTLTATEAFAAGDAKGVAVVAEGTAYRLSSTIEGSAEGLRTRRAAVKLLGGRRYRITVTGRYAPAAPPLANSGDELMTKLRYRSEGATDLTLALRSIEDPETPSATETWHVGEKEKGTHEVKLVTDPQRTGFYVTLGVRGAGVDVDDVEVSRQGIVVAAAKAESPTELGLQTDCSVLKVKPLSGKGSFRCASGEGDRLTLGKPSSFLALSLRDAGGERAGIHTQSLEGGRSVDASLSSDGELAVVLVGPGAATLERIEVTELGSGK